MRDGRGKEKEMGGRGGKMDIRRKRREKKKARSRRRRKWE